MLYRALTYISATCLLLLALRRHLIIAGEVVYSYSAFPHQQLNYYQWPVQPGDELHQPVQGDAQVPRLVHQILLTSEADTDQANRQMTANMTLSRYRDAMASCKDLHKDWTFHLWTDTTAAEFVTTNYPHLLRDYMSYAQTIQRTNILRYLLLHHFGGVYLDLDLKCRAPLDGLLHLPWLTPGAFPSGINNAFILSKKGHPFLEFLISRIHSHNVL